MNWFARLSRPRCDLFSMRAPLALEPLEPRVLLSGVAPMAGQPPTVSNVERGTHAGVTLAFAPADFTAAFSDPDPGDQLQVVRLTSLPGEGTLLVGGVPAEANQEIPTAQLNTLSYAPAAGYVGAAGFAWNGSDGTQYAAADALVNISVNNAVPVLTSVTPLPGAIEDADFPISYLLLANASDASDADGDPISFSVESVTSGTLLKDGAPVVPGATLLAAGESLLWHPAPNNVGTTGAFKVRAWDGYGPSAGGPIQVSVGVLPVNDPPGSPRGLTNW
ncbi:MAG: LEPR-XLL domain-containing protein [Planctomycetes bacterium]|nr:LEPR-XLL domain-containing protein [Planctomycetota bacterium]